jgi:hypothetical protein
MQTTSQVLMIRPVNFSFNAETAINNAFQTAVAQEKVQETALAEFDGFVALLRRHGVLVTVINDTTEPFTPDSIFPNNWISFHSDGTICLFPMYAANRRLERNPAILNAISDQFLVKRCLDFSHYEQENLFLEGTGSMVLDRENKIAYACLSARTNEKVLADFGEKMGYTAIVFHANDNQGAAIYHTNVMMCIADRYAVVCLSSIPLADERKLIKEAIAGSGKKLIDISLEQLNHFAGNMLQLQNVDKKQMLVMSTQAYLSLSSVQQQELNSFNAVIHAPLNSIESSGGGSARCMIAEIFLPPRQDTKSKD